MMSDTFFFTIMALIICYMRLRRYRMHKAKSIAQEELSKITSDQKLFEAELRLMKEEVEKHKARIGQLTSLFRKRSPHLSDEAILIKTEEKLKQIELKKEEIEALRDRERATQSVKNQIFWNNFFNNLTH